MKGVAFIFIAREGRTVEKGQRVEVYRNLHRDAFSIRDKKTKLVLGYSNHVRLEHATYIVSEARRQKVLEEKRKNVHAVVEGTFVETLEEVSIHMIEEYKQAYYNPYLTETFVDKESKEALYHSSYALFTDNELFYKP